MGERRARYKGKQSCKGKAPKERKKGKGKRDEGGWFKRERAREWKGERRGRGKKERRKRKKRAKKTNETEEVVTPPAPGPSPLKGNSETLVSLTDGGKWRRIGVAREPYFLASAAE